MHSATPSAKRWTSTPWRFAKANDRRLPGVLSVATAAWAASFMACLAVAGWGRRAGGRAARGRREAVRGRGAGHDRARRHRQDARLWRSGLRAWLLRGTGRIRRGLAGGAVGTRWWRRRQRRELPGRHARQQRRDFARGCMEDRLLLI